MHMAMRCICITTFQETAMEYFSGTGMCRAKQRLEFGAHARICSLMLLMVVCAQAEPDPTNGHPNWQERGILVLTNACRMDPPGFRDAYIGSYDILLPASYPPTTPIYWYYPFNVCARNHSLDMANNCGMSHNSCDGTLWDSRVKACYDYKSPKIGENIATGQSAPLGTMKQWILDKPQGKPVPADKTTDGHRGNIMDGNFKEMGAGYAYGPKLYRHFWTQDLGGATPEAAGNIVSGSHFFFEQDKTSFLAVYYDASGAAPASATLILDGVAHAIPHHLGTEAKGVYRLDLTEGSACRYYHFEFADGSQKKWRYPETGNLATYGEGACEEYYTTGSTSRIMRNAGSRRYVPAGNSSELALIITQRVPSEVVIMAGNGRLLQRFFIENRHNRKTIRIPLKAPLSSGVYPAVLKFRDSSHEKIRLMISR
jgi:hypothetical protein